MIFFILKKNGFWGILGSPSYGIGATIRIGQEMLCLLYAGFFFFKLTFWGGGVGVNANLETVYILIFWGDPSLKSWVSKTTFDIFERKKSPSLPISFQNVIHSPPLGQCLKESYFYCGWLPWIESCWVQGFKWTKKSLMVSDLSYISERDKMIWLNVVSALKV